VAKSELATTFAQYEFSGKCASPWVVCAFCICGMYVHMLYTVFAHILSKCRGELTFQNLNVNVYICIHIFLAYMYMNIYMYIYIQKYIDMYYMQVNKISIYIYLCMYTQEICTFATLLLL